MGGNLMKPLRVGVVGAGVAARLHAHAYASAGDAIQLAAVVDVDHERARRMRRQFGFEAEFTDLAQVLARADVDVLSVCTPANTHAEIVLAAIEAGKHVLVEKPLAITDRDTRTIAAAAFNRPELCISCVFQHRDDPAMRRARWLLENDAIGRVLSVHCSARTHRGRDYYADRHEQRRTDGGGALMVLGIHLLDALGWLVGGAQSVSATMSTLVHDTDAEDMFAGWARLRSGGVATIDCTTCAQSDEYAITMLGATGSMQLAYRPGWARTWTLRTDGRSARGTRKLSHEAVRQFPPASRLRARHVATLAVARVPGQDRIPEHLGHGPHIRRFLEAIETGAPAPIGPVDGARSVEEVLAFYRSAETGKCVEVNSSPSRPAANKRLRRLPAPSRVRA